MTFPFLALLVLVILAAADLIGWGWVWIPAAVIGFELLLWGLTFATSASAVRRAF